MIGEIENKKMTGFTSELYCDVFQCERMKLIGFKDDTADVFVPCGEYEGEHCSWSLGRLLEMIPCEEKIIRYDTDIEVCGIVFDKNEELYDNVIDALEWFVSEGELDDLLVEGHEKD